MIFTPENWCKDAADGLEATFQDYSADQVCAAVTRGSWNLWRCWNSERGTGVALRLIPCGWLVTENQAPVAFLWSYQGRDSCEMISSYMEIAKLQGCNLLRFNTKHKGLHRLFKRFEPMLICELGGVKTYEIRVH